MFILRSFRLFFNWSDVKKGSLMMLLKKIKIIITLGVMLWVTVSSVFAQEANQVNNEESTDELVKASRDILDKLSKPVDLTTRDPFSVSETVAIGSESVGGYEFYPSEGANLLPKLRLRGYIGDEDDTPVALLDIENHGIFLVRKGDTVGLQIGGRNTVLKIKDITKLSVLVEVGTIGQVVIVK